MTPTKEMTEGQRGWLELLESSPEAATYWMTDERYQELKVLGLIDHNGLTPAGRYALQEGTANNE